MFEHLDVLFALLAGVIYTVIMIILGQSLNEWVLNLILIMVIMLSLGRIFKSYVKNKVLQENKVEDVIEESNIIEEESPVILDEEIDYDNGDIPMFDEDDE